MKALNEQCRILITNDEKVLYMGSLHFFYGFRYMLICMGLLGAATLVVGLAWVNGEELTQALVVVPTLLLILGGAASWLAYAMPFWRSFFVITDQRALVGIGRFTIVQEQILPHQMEDWEIRENYLEELLGYGHLTLRMIEGRQLRIITIPYLRQPHLFTRYLDEIAPIQARPQEAEKGTEPSPKEERKKPRQELVPEPATAAAVAAKKPKKVPSNYIPSPARPPPNKGKEENE